MTDDVSSCRQHVIEPTHTGGHTLDLIITRTDTSICDLRVGDTVSESDHAMFSFKLESVQKVKASVQLVERRAWRRLSSSTFAADLQMSALCRDLGPLNDMSVDDLASTYDRVLTELLDQHCPVVTVNE